MCIRDSYGGIINGTKAKKWGRYRSWLIMVPWMVPFLYAFMFIRVSDNEWVSAVVIIAASIASHVAWNFSYVANATLISVVGKTQMCIRDRYATEALLGLDDYCMEYIGAYREGLIGPVKK